jgi:thiol-disulfide isomerase/thioredoxin
MRTAQRRRWNLAWLAAIVLVGVTLGVLASLPLLRGDPNGSIGSLVGEPAPSLSAVGLDGRTWSLADGRDRLTWVNFWATSCEPCRTEMPAMQALAETYGERLLVLGVDWGDSRTAVEDFVARYAIGYPILLDPELAAADAWGATAGLPRHFFVDGNGVVVREVIGELPPNRMVAILEDLIGPA